MHWSTSLPITNTSVPKSSSYKTAQKYKSEKVQKRGSSEVGDEKIVNKALREYNKG